MHTYIHQSKQVNITISKNQVMQIPYSRKVWQIDSFQTFDKRKLGELTDQLIGNH